MLRDGLTQGDGISAFVLATFYETGKPCLTKDMAAAARYYEQSAEAGYMNGMVRIGYHYATGIGVEPNEELARSWFRRAVLRTVRDSPTERLQNMLGALGDRSMPEALLAEMRWIEEVMVAAPQSRYQVALQLRDGRGLPRDGRAALRILFSIQHDSGPQVSYEIGRGLLTGEYPFNPQGPSSHVDVPDASEIARMGIEILRSASDDNHVPALVLLARVYATGVDGVCYPAWAYTLLQRALFFGAGVDELSPLLRQLETRTTEAERHEASRLARNRLPPLGPDAGSGGACP